MRFSLIFYLLLFFTASCNMSSWPESVETGFEAYHYSGDSLFIDFDEKSYYSEAIIDSVAFEGKYSLFASQSGAIAFEYPIESPKPDSKYLITCWRQSIGEEGFGAIVALADINGRLIEIARTQNPATVKNDWQMLELLLQLPPNFNSNRLLIRLENAGDNPVWFDELKIEFIDKVYYPEFEEEETLQINITDPDLERLREKRLEAFENGFIDVGKDDWIKAEVYWRDTLLNARIRFKGDNLKHLEGDKWSFTIDIDNGTVMGMGRFAIQTPEARSFLDEWLFHKVLQQEGLATSKYSFAPVSLNDRSIGVYAIVEDQRDEDFLSRFGNGVVLRFEDHIYWENKLSSSKISDSAVLKEAEIQSIASLGLEKITIESFEKDIDRFRNIEENVAELFNNEKTSIMLAVCDVLKAYNSLHWVNIRFYGNAESGDLEFIGHDGFSTFNNFNFGNKPFIAFSKDSVVEEKEAWRAMYFNLLNDTVFANIYFEHLDRISQEQYFNVLKLNIIGEMKHYQTLFSEEWPDYRFNFAHYYKDARLIRKQLKVFRAQQKQERVMYKYAP